MINNQLRDEIGTLNASKGWHDEPRSIAQHCILLHSEVSEIVEDYRKNKAINEVWYEYGQGGNYVSPFKMIYENEFMMGGDKNLVVRGKPCGIPSELADVVIRALDMAYEYEVDVQQVFDIDYDDRINHAGFEELIGDLHYIISQIFYYEDLDYLSNLIGLSEYISDRYNINLEQQIRDKIEYNRTRPIKHGGKRL